MARAGLNHTQGGELGVPTTIEQQDGTMTPGRRVDRPLSELVAALHRHVKLLRDYMANAFERGEEAYLGEVAGKLRLLVGARGGNTPLLLDLMKVLDLKVPFVLGGAPPIKKPRPQPGAGDVVTLRQYLGQLNSAGKTPSGGQFTWTNSDFIHAWAQQHGSAHEDWTLDEGFVALRDSDLFIGGMHVAARSLRGVARTVLYVADKVLAQATPGLIEAAERRRRRAP